MPVAAAVPLITAGLGVAGQALGGSGRQGGSEGVFAQTGQSNQTGSQTANRSGTTTSQQTELAALAPFRNLLMGTFGNALNDAQTPAFGQAEIANVLNNVNEASNAASRSLTSRLARVGAGDSGRAAVGQGVIEANRASDISNFLSQVPQLNRQARQAALNPLLSLGLGFVGRGPQGVTSTTNDNATTDFSSTRDFSQEGTSDQNILGGSFLSNLLSGGGEFAQKLAFPALFGDNQGGNIFQSGVNLSDLLGNPTVSANDTRLSLPVF